MKTFASNPCARRSLAFALAVFLLGAAGCSSLLEPRPDPSRFYLLTPQPPAGEVSPASAGGSLSVGLGPITMPAYLDRPQTVTRVGANELRISEVDRWAEPLAKNFARVLGQDLAARLDGARLHDYPWYNSTAIDYQIEVAVHRFETDASGEPARGALDDSRWARQADARCKQHDACPKQRPGRRSGKHRRTQPDRR